MMTCFKCCILEHCPLIPFRIPFEWSCYHQSNPRWFRKPHHRQSPPSPGKWVRHYGRDSLSSWGSSSSCFARRVAILVRLLLAVVIFFLMSIVENVQRSLWPLKICKNRVKMSKEKSSEPLKMMSAVASCLYLAQRTICLGWHMFKRIAAR